jgi:hypothetical protein
VVASPPPGYQGAPIALRGSRFYRPNTIFQHRIGW